MQERLFSFKNAKLEWEFVQNSPFSSINAKSRLGFVQNPPFSSVYAKSGWEIVRKSLNSLENAKIAPWYIFMITSCLIFLNLYLVAV